MRFTDAYAACPVCSPTRESIMTGKYPARMDSTDWFGAPQPEEVPGHHTRNKLLLPARYSENLALREVTVAEAFKDAGYKTFFAGKWHLGETAEYWPEYQGFDVNKGGHSKGWPPGGYFAPWDNPRLENGPDGEHLPDRLARETVKFIKEHKDKPFLAYLSFYSVHTPLQSREDLKQKYLDKKEKLGLEAEWVMEGRRKVRAVQENEVYAGMVDAMDQAVGKVLDTLKESGLDEHTAIFFMSDNGGLSTAEGRPTSNLPLRAGKGWLYEGGIREPMIIKWPRVVRAGSVCNEPVTSTDFYPTMLEMADLALRPGQHCDGVSLAPLLQQKGKLKRKAIYWHYPHYGNQGGRPGGAVRTGDYKLIEFYDDNHVELYNLKDDIGEKNDLSTEKPKKAAKLRKMLQEWRKAVDAQMPKRNPEYRPKANEDRK